MVLSKSFDNGMICASEQSVIVDREIKDEFERLMREAGCYFLTADETEKLLAKEVQAYVLTVDTRNNGKESITAKEAGLVYKPDGGAKKLIKKQARYKWFLAFNQKKKYTLATDTAYEDQNKLTEAVKNLKCMQKDNMEKPADACIKDNGCLLYTSPSPRDCS